MYLNGTRLPVKSFADYCDLYLGPKENGVPRIHERVSDRWEIVISATDGQFQQVRCLWRYVCLIARLYAGVSTGAVPIPQLCPCLDPDSMHMLT